MTNSCEPHVEGRSSLDQSPTIVGQDPGLLAVLARATRIAPTRIPVLISGESGTGKELFAELLHRRGTHPDGPFVAVNCGALPRELAESELFGHERGAFTGAGQRKAGWFEEADRGTLVLDEIGELPLDLQPKLLRVLETGRLRRVGGSGEVSVRVRVAAMTLRDLRHDVARGTFRNDLYHRLAGFELVLPPLRHRRGDIALLAERFLAELTSELGKDRDNRGGGDRARAGAPCFLDEAALRELTRYDWPGNVRELRNVLRRAAILSPGLIDCAALELPQPPATTPLGSGAPEKTQLADGDGHSLATSFHAGGMPASSLSWPPSSSWANSQSGVFRSRAQAGDSVTGCLPGHLPGALPDNLPMRGRTFDQIERAVFVWALAQNGGSRRQAARALGLPRSSFSDKVKRYGLA